jgi:ParB family chromosome partitioning protein
MVREKLAEETEAVRAEGWKWVEVDTEFPYDHTFGMRRIHGEAVPMSDEEAASYQALTAEYDVLEAEHAEADDLPDDVDTRLVEIEEAIEALEASPIRYDAEDLALAGAFVSIDSSGRLRVDRGYVRPEDEPVEEVEDTGEVVPEAAPVEDIHETVVSTTEEE